MFGLYLLPKCDYSEIDLLELRKHLIWFFVGFVILYELSTPFASKIIISEYYDIERKYRDGFVISHLAAYYLGVLGFFMFRLGDRWVARSLWVYVLTLGARIGIIYIIISLIIIILYTIPSASNRISKFKYWIICGIIFMFSTIIGYVVDRYGSEVLMVFTSGRSYFQLQALEQIINDGISIENILGRGPKASNRFNLDSVGIAIWMHNDFLDILFNIGILGLIIYLKSFINYFKQIKALNLFFIFFLTAFLNGFMTYDALYIITLSTVFDKRGYQI